MQSMYCSMKLQYRDLNFLITIITICNDGLILKCQNMYRFIKKQITYIFSKDS